MIAMRNFFFFTLAFVLAFIGLTSHSQSANADNPLQDDILTHGKYIATIAGCTSCHTPDKVEYQNPKTLTLEQIQTLAFDGENAIDSEKFLAGGRLFDLGPAGGVYTRNLTPDETTGIGKWTKEQIKIAIKTGLSADGKTLFPVMPYHTYNSMADADVEAVVAFVRSVDAVSNKVPQDTVKTDGMPTLPYTQGITAPDPADKAARGAYLVNSVMACTDCHTPVDPATGAPIIEKYLAGGQPYEGPWGIVYGGNITPDPKTGIGDWTEEQIKSTMISGTRKDGRRLILMPWYAYQSLSPQDADAIAYYLKNGLPAVNNEVPKASLKDGFVVMAPAAESTDNKSVGSPLLWGAIGVLIVALAIVGGVMFFRRKNRIG
jgi:mono/diheme cytochrome c family protein